MAEHPASDIPDDPPDPFDPFGEWVRRQRIQQYMTQAELARRAGCGVPYISKIEAGKERPSPETTAAIVCGLVCGLVRGHD